MYCIFFRTDGASAHAYEDEEMIYQNQFDDIRYDVYLSFTAFLLLDKPASQSDHLKNN